MPGNSRNRGQFFTRVNCEALTPDIELPTGRETGVVATLKPPIGESASYPGR